MSKKHWFIQTVALCGTLAACGGGSSGIGETTSAGSGGNASTVSAASAHNPLQVPQAIGLADNLIDNGGFENATLPWDLCGTASIVTDSTDAAEGNRYLRLDNTAQCDRFSQSILEESYGWAYRPIELESIPDILHISLLARTTTAIELFEDHFAIRLMASENRADFFSRREATFLNSVDNAIDSNWTRVKLSLTREEIQEQIGDLVPQWLIIEALGPGGSTEIGIDDIRLTTRAEFTQPAAMPDSLVNQAAQNQLAMYDVVNSKLVTTAGDGSLLTRYNSVSIDFAVSYPSYASNGSIVFADRRFDPLTTSDPAVVPAAGSTIFQVALETGIPAVISQQPGTPGYYLFEGAAGNSAAIDINVKSLAWSTPNNVGLNGVCAQNRLPTFVSDEVCFLQLMDASGNTSLTEIEASSAAFSPDGTQLAYLSTNGKNIHIGSLTGTNITATVAHASRANLYNHLSFSPDGKRLLMGAQSAASIALRGATDFPSQKDIILCMPRYIWPVGGY